MGLELPIYTKASSGTHSYLYVLHLDALLYTIHHFDPRGTNTAQTVRDERLINRFDYDGDYGTVLNRFLMQAALKIPLTGTACVY